MSLIFDSFPDAAKAQAFADAEIRRGHKAAVKGPLPNIRNVVSIVVEVERAVTGDMKQNTFIEDGIRDRAKKFGGVFCGTRSA